VAQQRLTTDQAARVLGVSVDAIRKRAERGQLPHVKEGNRLYILLDDVATQSGDDVEGKSGALISQMQARIDSLGWQLEQANDRDREIRRIIAALTQRIPELPGAQAPSSRPEPPEAPEQDTEEAPRAKLLVFLQVLLAVVAAGTLPVVSSYVAISLVFSHPLVGADSPLSSPTYIYLWFHLIPLFCGLYTGLTWKGIHLRGHMILGLLAGIIDTVTIAVFHFKNLHARDALNEFLIYIGGRGLFFPIDVSDIIAVFATITLFLSGGIFGDLLERAQSPRKKDSTAWATLLVPGMVTGAFGILANIVASSLKSS
jgi:excisionase family DNA binding protein